MPLIVVTGLPSCGKSTVANKIAELLKEKIAEAKTSGRPGANLNVILHSDETLGIPHDDYRESRTEKSARGAQMTAIKRDLTRNNIVILDSLCYIKGFRYQLFCEVKSMATTHCVIQLLAPLDICLSRNAARPQNEQWDPELIKQLEMRYEEPDGRSRWDSPLIPVLFDDTEVPINDVWKALVYPSKQLKPNNATMLKQANSGNFLQDLDKLTQQVISKVVEYQQIQGASGIGSGGTVVIEKGDREEGVPDLSVELPLKVVSTAQLQRIRRTYVALNRVRAVEINRIVPLFVEYLNNSLNNDDL